MAATTEAPATASSDEEPPERTIPGRAVLQWTVLAFPALWVAVAGWRHRWMTEDGFIYLRIVEQLTAGNGPVFNAGERVEAYTGPAWVGLLAIADLLTPVRLEWLSVVLGLVTTAAGVLLATLGARRLWPARDAGLCLPLGALVFVALYPTWSFTTSGLETGLVFAWLGACTWILATWASSSRRELGWWRVVLLGAGWVVRPELVIYSLGFLVLVAAGQRGRRRKVRVVLIGVALPVAYQLFRMGYFGSLVANTAIAKEGSQAQIDRGWRYFLDFVEPYWLWVPAVALVAAAVPLVRDAVRAGFRRRVGVVVVLVGAGIVNAGYVVVVGGDYHHARMLLPALFACCAPFAAVPISRATAVATVVVPVWALVAVLTLRPEQLGSAGWLANGFLAQDPSTNGVVTTDDAGWGKGDVGLEWFTGTGYFHQTNLGTITAADVPLDPEGPDPLAAMWGIGITGFAPGIDLHVLDQMGLADWLASHLDIAGRPPGTPGHEKPLPAPWVAARVAAADSRPLSDRFPNFGVPLIPPTTGAAFDEQVAWARAAVECPELVELRRSATSALGVGDVVDNLLGSFANTFVRIPADPEVAYHRFCGSGVPAEVEAVRAGAPPP